MMLQKMWSKINNSFKRKAQVNDNSTCFLDNENYHPEIGDDPHMMATVLTFSKEHLIKAYRCT